MADLKDYQTDAVAAVVGHLNDVAPGDPAQFVLLEAPTGSGKTLMAGTVAVRLSKEKPILWFWFAPFAGLVDQSAATLHRDFPELRTRRVAEDRNPNDLRPGDVYVTTWSAVAARQAGSLKARSETETLASLDQIIELARDAGWLVGAVVDEAHHGFVTAPVARDFFRTVLRPDITVLVTATPNDDDIEAFEEQVGVGRVIRVSVSRADAVEAGLIKEGIRAVAFVPAQGVRPDLVDFERTALRFAWETHCGIRERLKQLGHPVVPLLLVQVPSGPDAVEQARTILTGFGVPAESIAVHTAAEPDPDVLAIAQDESKEVLIFKMAVALGFDAPRAWVLASLRPSVDVQFGLQIVGRVLRVDRRLHGVDLPEALAYGYVYVAHQQSQQGLLAAADQINRLKTEINVVDPQAGVVAVPILPQGGTSPAPAQPGVDRDAATTALPHHGRGGGHPRTTVGPQNAVVPAVTSGEALDLFGTLPGHDPLPGAVEAAHPPRPSYPLRADGLGAPSVFRTEAYAPDAAGVADCVAARIEFDRQRVAEVLVREDVQVIEQAIEVFTRKIEQPRGVQGTFDLASLTARGAELLETWKRGGTVLFKSDFVDGKLLLPRLRDRLRTVLRSMGSPLADDTAEVMEVAVKRIIGQDEALLTRAIAECLRDVVEVLDAAPLPPELVATNGTLAPSRLNVYGVLPEGLNEWERRFAELLDSDTTGTVLWWHRNESRQPHSVRVCAPLAESGDFYPDFVVGVHGRKGGTLLIDPKRDDRDVAAKIDAAHAEYGRVMLLEYDRRANEWYIWDRGRTGAVEKGRRFEFGLLRSH